MVVVIPGRGLVKFTRGGARRSIAFAGRDAGRFRDDVDRAALAARSTAPADVAAKLVEAFPWSEVRE